MINSFQILRAFAAFSVFMAHYALFGLHVGGFGVDIFFIISGFVIAFVAHKSTDQFLLKRLIRVVPLYTIATLFTTALVIINPSWFKNVVVNTEAIIKSLLYIPYRIDHSGPILSLGWTLNFEMFFYLIASISIILVSNTKYIVPVCISLLTVFLVSVSIADTEYYPIKFYKEGQLPEFLYGLLLYYFWGILEKHKHFKKYTLFFVVIIIMSIAFLVYTSVSREFAFLNRNIRFGIPCLLIVAGTMALEPYLNSNNKIVKFLCLIGDSSYAMYLFHPFILFGFTRVIFPKVFGDYNNPIVEIIKFIIISIILFIISIVLYKYLDKPINKFLRNKFLTIKKRNA